MKRHLPSGQRACRSHVSPRDDADRYPVPNAPEGEIRRNALGSLCVLRRQGLAAGAPPEKVKVLRSRGRSIKNSLAPLIGPFFLPIGPPLPIWGSPFDYEGGEETSNGLGRPSVEFL